MTTTPVAARLRDLSLEVVRLASLTTNAVATGTDALVDGDLVNAQRLIDDDDVIDSVRHSIEDNCLVLIAEGALEPGAGRRSPRRRRARVPVGS